MSQYQYEVSLSNASFHLNKNETFHKKWICEFNGCMKSYSTNGNLKTHQKIHNGKFVI